MTGVAEERDQRSGDDHRRVVKRGDEEDGRRGGDDRDDPGRVDIGRVTCWSSDSVAASACDRRTGRRAPRRRSASTHDPEQRVGRLGQWKRIGGRTSRGINGQDEDDRRNGDADD